MDMPKVQNHTLTPGKKKPVSEFSDTGYMRRVIPIMGGWAWVILKDADN
jgi:hypothetical protein